MLRIDVILREMFLHYLINFLIYFIVFVITQILQILNSVWTITHNRSKSVLVVLISEVAITAIQDTVECIECSFLHLTFNLRKMKAEYRNETFADENLNLLWTGFIYGVCNCPHCFIYDYLLIVFENIQKFIN